MRNNLILKLMGAFLLIIAIGGGVISFLMPRATRNAFQLYSTRSNQVYARQLVPVFSEHYLQNNGWQNVEQFILSESLLQAMPGMMGNGMGKNQNRNNTQELNSTNGMGMQGMELRFILADENGLVIVDTLNEMTEKQISESDLQNGAAIMVNNQLAGTLIVSQANFAQRNTLAGDFLSSVNKAIFSSAGIAGIIALFLGGILFFQITSPLRQLKNAATRIASGDLTQRVNIHTQDEFGELGKTFNSMAESLENAELQRRQLTADIAHELRTPLTAIQATLEGIQDGVLPFNEEQTAALYSESLLLNRLVGDLRQVSLADAGQLKLDFHKTDVSVLLRQVIEHSKTQSDQKGIVVFADIQPDIPLIYLDADRITQVLNNLIRNSLMYTPEGGTITIQAKLNPAQDFLEISVQDSGTGIDPADLLRVFDRFYRADKSRARLSGGSGLGLTIVKNFVEAHGGNVYAESPVYFDENQTGYGTRIYFTLPIEPRSKIN